jgi:hypothetical protein
MQRNSKPIAWRPRGLSDTLESSSTFVGAMAALSNLIPDPTTRGLWQCRPAAQPIVNFGASGGPFSSGFSSGFQQSSAAPGGVITALQVIGTYAYGMIGSGIFPGHDQPFAYNLLTNTNIPISGVTNANTPISPAATGAWVPPTTDLIGVDLCVTHPGFNGANGYFGVLNISNPAAPSWSSGNLTGLVQFTTPPSAVKQFNQRAYWITNNPLQPALVFSDPLVATNCTNANQVLTFGDNVSLTALGQLPFTNTQTGGVVQALIVFKGVKNIYQVTGDAADMNLSINSLNVTTGTLAPNTVCNTPKGLAFVSPDGVRQIDFFAHVSDPIGFDGMGVTVPFIYSVVPSRMCASCGGNVLRITTQNGNLGGSPNFEYWYDVARGIWSGPHTFPMALIQPYNNTFIGVPLANTSSLWQSDPVQSDTSTYVENGQQLTWTSTTPLLPDPDRMTNTAMTETTLDVALAATIPPVIANALNENGVVLNTASIASVGTATLWGAFTWGAADWGTTGGAALAPQQLQWTNVIVFTRMQLQVTGQSATGIKLGTSHFRFNFTQKYISSIQAALPQAPIPEYNYLEAAPGVVLEAEPGTGILATPPT